MYAQIIMNEQISQTNAQHLAAYTPSSTKSFFHFHSSYKDNCLFFLKKDIIATMTMGQQ